MVLTAVVALEPTLLARLPSAWLDTYQALTPRTIKSTPATIVQIDHKSLAQRGQWPWPRSLLAELIEEIGSHQPAAIGLDVFMPEPDGYRAENLLARSKGHDPALVAALAALPSNDTLLAHAVSTTPTVLA